MTDRAALPLRLGVDTGGTFVDLVVADEAGALRLYKVPSDPQDLAGAVLAGLAEAAADGGLALADFLGRAERIVHGSTVATNALLTRRGARAALITTRGFRDVLNMRRGARDQPLNSRRPPPAPLIPRTLIYPVAERLDRNGQELVPLALDEVDAATAALRETDVEGVAVCFLFSFLDPTHELAVGERLAAALPGVHVSLSSEVLPQVRFYERESTTAVNAVVSPLLARYLDALDEKLRANGFRGSFLVMQSNGGVCSLDYGKRFGVRSVLSGPAAAPVAAAHVAGLCGVRNAISVDMGGTSFDVCLIADGQPQVTTEGELAGQRIALPMVAIHTIGAGGGSIVGVDSRGMLQVGPASAGAYPGPACYRRGGTEPTVTDANLLLGYVDPKLFWGGRLALDVEAAERAFQERVAGPLGLEPIRAAYGAYQVVNENMVDAIREVSIRRGHDPRQFVLVAAGGAGPLHIGALARALAIPLVIIPRLASVFCALGGLLSDLRHEFTSSFVVPLDALDRARADVLLTRLRDQAWTTLRGEGVADRDAVLAASVDLRYVGQFNEVEVPLPAETFAAADLGALAEEFHRRHEAVNGYRAPGHGLELVALRIVAVGQTDKPTLPLLAADGAGEPPARGERSIYWDDAYCKVPVYDGLALAPGRLVGGPAIVEQATTTILVPPAYVLLTDQAGNGLMYPHDQSLDAVFARLGKEAR